MGSDSRSLTVLWASSHSSNFSRNRSSATAPRSRSGSIREESLRPRRTSRNFVSRSSAATSIDSAVARASRAKLRRRRASASGREVSISERTRSGVNSLRTSIPCWAIWLAVCSKRLRISCCTRVSGSSTSSSATSASSSASWRPLRRRCSLSSCKRVSRSVRSSANVSLSLAWRAKASSRGGSSRALSSSRLMANSASRPAASCCGYESGNVQRTVRLSPSAMPRIPSTNPGIIRSSSSSTSMPSLLPPLIGSPLSMKVPEKLTWATSPLAATRPSTGTRVAIWRRDCSISSSTRAGSWVTGSTSAFSPRVLRSEGVGCTSSSRVKVSASPGSKRSSTASKPSLSSGRPRAAISTCPRASRNAPSTRSSSAVARIRRGPICCSSTGRGTRPLRKPGRRTLRLSFSSAIS